MNKCNKCGYDYSGSGDSAHVCGPIRIQQRTEQEPVAKYSDIVSDGGLDPRNKFDAPPQRTWVGLTDEEKIIMSRYDLEYAALIGEVERKLKEKNNG